MQYRSLGRSGVLVSPLCLGAMNFGTPTAEAESQAIMRRALEAGINFIDTADVYNAGESERIVGRFLKDSGQRDQVILATKVYNATGPGPNDRGNSRRHIIQGCEESLRRLQTEYIDLYQLHRPVAAIPIDETLGALDQLVRQGKVLYVGTSTFPAWQVMEALAVSEAKGLARFVTEQPPYNLLDRRIENELVPLAMKYGVGLLPWSPLAGGMLAGRYRPGEAAPADSRAARMGAGLFGDRITAAALAASQAVAALANEAGMTPAQLALLWAKDQPGITAPIIGPRTLAHLEDTLVVLDTSLSPDLNAALDRIAPPGGAVTDYFNSNEWGNGQGRFLYPPMPAPAFP